MIETFGLDTAQIPVQVCYNMSQLRQLKDQIRVHELWFGAICAGLELVIFAVFVYGYIKYKTVK